MKLTNLDLPWKLLVTMFLVVLSAGFLVSQLYLLNQTEMADGKEGMSIDDIVFKFHGNPDKTATKLKTKVEGSMKKYFSAEPDLFDGKFSPEEQAAYDKVLAWNAKGAPETGFLDPKDPKAGIHDVMYNRGCFDCHSKEGSKPELPLDTVAAIAKVTKPDMGVDKSRLLMLSHVHLLGMGMMMMLVGAAVACTQWPVWMRSGLIVGGLTAILMDIFGWWGVKYGGPMFAPIVMAGGATMGMCFGGSVLASFYDLWLRKKVTPSVPTPTPTEGPVLKEPEVLVKPS